MVYYYPMVLELKANFDLTQEWDIKAKSLDRQKPDELKNKNQMKTRKSKTGTKITAVAIAAATVVGAIAIRRKQLFILLMVGAVCLGTSQSVQAQCTAKNEAFQSGEHVMYDLYFNWKFIWKKVGLASLTTNATTYHSEPAFRFNLLCVGSKKTDFSSRCVIR